MHGPIRAGMNHVDAHGVTTGGFLDQKAQNASPSVACRRPPKREGRFRTVCLTCARGRSPAFFNGPLRISTNKYHARGVYRNSGGHNTANARYCRSSNFRSKFAPEKIIRISSTRSAKSRKKMAFVFQASIYSEVWTRSVTLSTNQGKIGRLAGLRRVVRRDSSHNFGRKRDPTKAKPALEGRVLFGDEAPETQ
jgi:hypothetical protein